MKLQNVPVVTGQTHTKRIRIVGEKYDNRQTGLSKLFAVQEKGKQLTPELQEYDYKGSPAVRLLVNGIDVGVFLSEDSSFYYKEKSNIVGYNNLKITCSVEYKEDKDGGIASDKNGEPIVTSRYYKTKLSLTIGNAGSKKTATSEVSAEPVPSTGASQPEQKKKRWQFWK